MSDAPQGPGWWQATDGKYYPPERHPQYRQSLPPPPAQAQQPRAGGGHMAPKTPRSQPSAPPVTPAHAAQIGGPPKESHRGRTILIVVGAIVLLIVIAAVASGSKKKTPAASGAASTIPAAGTPATASTVAPAATHSKVGTLSDPVPLGQTVAVMEGGKAGWSVKVVSITPEATDSIAGTPPAGITFEVVTLQLTRTGSMPESPIEVQGTLIANKVERSVDTDPMCYGGSPDNDNLYTGGTANSGDCISVPTAYVPTMVLAVSADFDLATTYFATH